MIIQTSKKLPSIKELGEILKKGLSDQYSYNVFGLGSQSVLVSKSHLIGAQVTIHEQEVSIVSSPPSVFGGILQIESIKMESVCPRCGTRSYRLHQNHRHIIKDLPLGEQQLFLEVNKRQFKCEKCKKPFSEELDFVDSRRKYTKRLADKTIEEVLDSDIHSVSKKGNVTTEEIERMLKDASKKSLVAKPSYLRRLGIDEIALVKGKGNYCAVLVDLDNSKLLAILPGRTQETIR